MQKILTLMTLAIVIVCLPGCDSWNHQKSTDINLDTKTAKTSNLNNNETTIKNKRTISKKSLKQKNISQNIYTNDEYGFSLNIPNGWLVSEEADEYTGEKFITFSNLDKNCTQENCLDNFLAFFVNVYPNTSSFVGTEFVALKSSLEKTASVKEKIKLVDGGIVDFFVVINGSNNEIKGATAFYQDKQYSYVFHIAAEIFSKTSGRQIEVDALRGALQTLRIN